MPPLPDAVPAAPALKGISTTSPFIAGHLYTRDQVAELIQMPVERRGGNWKTGYDRWNGDFYLFCTIGGAGRTGHDYPNRWDGPLLHWSAKTGSQLNQPQIQDMLSGQYRVHVFWRHPGRSPFTYAGEAKVHEVQDTSPVLVTWHFDQEDRSAFRPAPTVHIVREPQAPIFRRGPAAAFGNRTISTQDSPTFVYVMRLTGPVEAIFPNLRKDHWIIKVGKSTNVERRRRELNSGFPHGCAVSWEIVDTRLYESDAAAFETEGRLLEALRLKGYWLNGEFAMVPPDDLPMP